MACYRPGDRPHLFRQLCAYRRRKSEPKSFSWADYRDLIIATHRNLSAPLVWCWDNLNIHLAPELADFAEENRAWLRVYQLPASAPDLNPAEGIWPLLKRAMANFAAAASGIAAPGDTANLVTDSDLVAVSLLGIRVTGYEALIITQYRAQEIAKLLGSIPVHARIDEEASAALLTRDGPAWRLWELLFEIKDRTKDSRFGGVAAGKLLARKRPGLIPIEDSRIAGAFRRLARSGERHLTATKAGGTTYVQHRLTLGERQTEPPCGTTSPISAVGQPLITFRSCACSTSSAGCTHATVRPLAPRQRPETRQAGREDVRHAIADQVGLPAMRLSATERRFRADCDYLKFLRSGAQIDQFCYLG